MGYEELLRILEIEDACEFENFEEFATLLECENPIEQKDMKKLLADVREDTLEELIKAYFDEIAESLPDNATESGVFFEIMVRMLVEKLYADKEEFAEELFKFRSWYHLDSEVEVQKSGTSRMYSFFNAITAYRADRLSGVTDNLYKFDEALNYKIDI